MNEKSRYKGKSVGSWDDRIGPIIMPRANIVFGSEKKPCAPALTSKNAKGWKDPYQIGGFKQNIS